MPKFIAYYYRIHNENKTQATMTHKRERTMKTYKAFRALGNRFDWWQPLQMENSMYQFGIIINDETGEVMGSFPARQPQNKED